MVGVFIGCENHHIRLINSEVRNAPWNGIFFCHTAEYNEVINCSIHGSVYHGLYITSSNNLFEGNRVYNNGWYGYHLYISEGRTINNNIIRNNEIYGNGWGRGDSHGIIISHGDNNVVDGNIVRNNSGGIQVAYGANNTQVYGNTVYGNTYGGINIDPSTTNTVVVNNNVYGNGWGIVDWGAINVSISNNTEW